MSGWWFVVVIVGLAAALLYRRARGSRSRGGRDDRHGGPGTDREFRQEREDARLARTSEEDRAWEAASLRRDRERRTGAGTDAPRDDAGGTSRRVP